jgi:hypothetical protein
MTTRSNDGDFFIVLRLATFPAKRLSFMESSNDYTLKSIASCNRNCRIFEDYDALLVRLWRDKLASKISEVLMPG